MADAISIAKASMLHDMHRMQVVSSNLSNVATPGYKREMSSGADFANLLKAYSASGVASANINADSVAAALVNKRDNSAGMLKQTKNRFDIALSDGVYLELSGANGTVYSRGGHFSKDSSGRLINSKGYVLMSDMGEVRISSDNIVVGVDGKILDGTTVIGKLNLVSFSDIGNLSYIGNGVYENREQANIDSPKNPRVLQGYLEMSNVNQADEMVRLIEITRHFEANQKIIRAYDSIMDSAINTLGDL